jgi:putative FmdB family regulatory protein
MPTYAYRCKKCEHYFEKMLKIPDRNDPEHEPCPECKAREVQMMLGATPLADPVRIGVTRPDSGWTEVLQKIHNSNPGSIIKQNSRYY